MDHHATILLQQCVQIVHPLWHCTRDSDRLRDGTHADVVPYDILCAGNTVTRISQVESPNEIRNPVDWYCTTKVSLEHWSGAAYETSHTAIRNELLHHIGPVQSHFGSHRFLSTIGTLDLSTKRDRIQRLEVGPRIATTNVEWDLYTTSTHWNCRMNTYI